MRGKQKEQSQPAHLSTGDRAILSELQRDCSTSSHALADRLGLSQSTLWRRIRELETSGAIDRRVAILNPDVVGAAVCAYVFINLVNYQAETIAAFRDLLSQTDEILECYSITGAFDHLISVRAADVHALRDLLLEKIAVHPSVANTSSHMTLDRLKFTTELPLSG